jgi:hypothetical protein
MAVETYWLKCRLVAKSSLIARFGFLAAFRTRKHRILKTYTFYKAFMVVMGD